MCCQPCSTKGRSWTISPSSPDSAVPFPTSSSDSATRSVPVPMSTQPSAAIDQRPRWPWVVLGMGLLWTALLRAPLILNAEDHLDSDLAVDGLTLLDAV